jgi:hypothetical protein
VKFLRKDLSDWGIRKLKDLLEMPWELPGHFKGCRDLNHWSLSTTSLIGIRAAAFETSLERRQILR